MIKMLKRHHKFWNNPKNKFIAFRSDSFLSLSFVCFFKFFFFFSFFDFFFIVKGSFFFMIFFITTFFTIKRFFKNQYSLSMRWLIVSNRHSTTRKSVVRIRSKLIFGDLPTADESFLIGVSEKLRKMALRNVNTSVYYLNRRANLIKSPKLKDITATVSSVTRIIDAQKVKKEILQKHSIHSVQSIGWFIMNDPQWIIIPMETFSMSWIYFPLSYIYYTCHYYIYYIYTGEEIFF